MKAKRCTIGLKGMAMTHLGMPKAPFSVADLRYAFRALYRRPLFALLELGLLTLSAAAVAAIFAVVSATLLRPLPFREPQSLYALLDTQPVAGDSLQTTVIAPIQLARWR